MRTCERFTSFDRRGSHDSWQRKGSIECPSASFYFRLQQHESRLISSFYWQETHDHNIFYNFQINWRLIHSWKGLCSCFALLINSHSLSCVFSIYFAILHLFFASSVLCCVLCVRLIAADDALINQELVCTNSIVCCQKAASSMSHSSWADTQQSPATTHKKAPKEPEDLGVMR